MDGHSDSNTNRNDRATNPGVLRTPPRWPPGSCDPSGAPPVLAKPRPPPLIIFCSSRARRVRGLRQNRAPDDHVAAHAKATARCAPACARKCAHAEDTRIPHVRTCHQAPPFAQEAAIAAARLPRGPSQPSQKVGKSSPRALSCKVAAPRAAHAPACLRPHMTRRDDVHRGNISIWPRAAIFRRSVLQRARRNSDGLRQGFDAPFSAAKRLH